MSDIGKIPPQAIDLEEAVLGALMLERGLFHQIEIILKPDMFYKPEHQTIFKAIKSLADKGDPVDIMTVTNKLKETGELEQVGGAYHVTQMTRRISGGMNTEYHAAIVAGAYVKRELIAMGNKAIQQGYDDGIHPDDIINGLQSRLLELNGFNVSSLKHISECIKNVFGIIDHNIINDGQITGIPTGFTYYDKFSNGLQKSDLVIIAGETSNGKTSLALNIAFNIAINGYGVGIFSYEMSKNQLSARLMSNASDISSKAILMEKLTDVELSQLNKRIKQLVDSRVYIDDCTSSDYSYLETEIKAAKIQHGIDVVIVDYLQLLRDGRKEKRQAIGDIANSLKTLAKALDITIVLLSQLRRSNDKPMPTLSRLKESGDIENAADVVWLVWLPYRAGENQIIYKGETIDSNGISQHIIAKGRNIGLTDFLLFFDEPTTKFKDYVTPF